MEVKKSQKADLENKKSLFLEIGLCVSLGLMILAFGISQGKVEVEDLSVEEELVVEEHIEITRQELETPQVPTPAQALSVLADAIEIVDNDTKIETELTFTDFDENVVFNTNPTSSEEIYGSSDEIFLILEDMPKFQGGDTNKFRNWVMGKVEYPEIAKSMQVEGTVTISFVVEKDGTVSSIEVLKGANSMLDKAAIAAVAASPKWEPGKQRDVPARVKLTIPVKFQIVH